MDNRGPMSGLALIAPALVRAVGGLLLGEAPVA